MKKTKDNSRRKERFYEWIPSLVLYVIFIIFFLFLYIVGRKNSMIHTVIRDEKVDVFQIIYNCVLSPATYINAILNPGIVWVLTKNREQITKLLKVIVGIFLFVMFCFFEIAVKYPLSQHAIALGGSVGCILCLGIAIVPKKSNSEIVTGEIQSVLPKITNNYIVSVQMYNVKKRELNDKIVYTVQYNDSIVKEGADINSILATEYAIKKDDLITLQSVVGTYLLLTESGNEATRTQLLEIINKTVLKLKNEISDITLEKVSKAACCTARLLMIYLSLRQMIDINDAGEEYISDGEIVNELVLHEGDLGIGTEVEKELFSKTRSGLLAAIMLGPELRYVFRYKKDGYKVGRKYCAFRVKRQNDSDSNFKVCLVAIEGEKLKKIPSDVMKAIKRIEKKISEPNFENGGALRE